MLDLSLRQVHYVDRKTRFELSADVTFARQTRTALAGPPGAGKTTILRLLLGDLRPERGEVVIGSRIVTSLRAARRPLLHRGRSSPWPGRWSVAHVLIAAARQRHLDRVDRREEIDYVAAKWSLQPLFERRLSTLSSTERVAVHCAEIEILRPAILLLERFFDECSPSVATDFGDRFYRFLRTIGCTVVSEPARTEELRWCDEVVIVREGAIDQRGTPHEVYGSPQSAAAAAATGDVNVVPGVVRRGEVETPIGSWPCELPDGEVVDVLLRPDHLLLAAGGEESDFILGVEEASFDSGEWLVRGMITGGLEIRARIAASEVIHKGRLLPIRVKSEFVRYVHSDRTAVTDVPASGFLPSRADSR